MSVYWKKELTNSIPSWHHLLSFYSATIYAGPFNLSLPVTDFAYQVGRMHRLSGKHGKEGIVGYGQGDCGDSICPVLLLNLSEFHRADYWLSLYFQVHHMSFLKACKNKKAVKEAFQFCKLIQNPTMSTFNMLLSVCASSQDFEGRLFYLLVLTILNIT